MISLFSHFSFGSMCVSVRILPLQGEETAMCYGFCLYFPDLNAKGVILQAFEMFRLKSCVDFKPYEGERTYIFFSKQDG